MATQSQDAPQRSMEWRYMRLGHVTASRFHDVVPRRASKSGGLSVGATSYLYELVGELLTDPPMVTPSPSGAALDWGIENEPAAIGAYSMSLDAPVELTGFHRHPTEPFVGGSPDVLVGDFGICEVKCPLTFREHVRHIQDGPPPHYVSQMRGLMWVLDREWCDFVSYDPRVRGDCQVHVRRIERDEKIEKQFTDHVLDFRDRILEVYQSITGEQARPLEIDDVRE